MPKINKMKILGVLNESIDNENIVMLIGISNDSNNLTKQKAKEMIEEYSQTIIDEEYLLNYEIKEI